MNKLKALFPILLILASGLCFGQKVTGGTWYNAEKTAQIQFFERDNRLFGKVVWLKVPDKNGKPRLDEHNPNEKLRNMPLMGLEVIKGLKKIEANKWENGTIYDPRNGKTYGCIVKLEAPGKLNVRGYIGVSLVGQTSTFYRATL